MVHSSVVLQKTKDGLGRVSTYKAKIVACATEDVENEEKSSSSIRDYKSLKLRMRNYVHRKYRIRHLIFVNAFAKDLLLKKKEEFLKHSCEVEDRHKLVMTLNTMLHGLKQSL